MHAVVWAVLGALPFGEDDRSGLVGAALLAACVVGTTAVLIWGALRVRPAEVVVDAVGSLYAALAVGSEVLAAPRVEWVLVPAALVALAAVCRLEARCVVCAALSGLDEAGLPHRCRANHRSSAAERPQRGRRSARTRLTRRTGAGRRSRA